MTLLGFGLSFSIYRCIRGFSSNNPRLIQDPYKIANLLSHQNFHTLGNFLDKYAPIHEGKTPQHVNKGFKGRDCGNKETETQTRKGLVKEQLCHKSQLRHTEPLLPSLGMLKNQILW